jgi:hypothetical protein
VVVLDGPSVRTKHLPLDEGASEPQDDMDRFSGKQAPDFPEPTRLSFLEEGTFRSGGYRCYEEFLGREFQRMPMLATTLLVTDPWLSRRPPEPAPTWWRSPGCRWCLAGGKSAA